MKRIFYLTTLFFTFCLGGFLCELSYETKIFADCNAQCFYQKHYLLGHCVLTELLDTPFLNGGCFMIPPRNPRKGAHHLCLVQVTRKQYIDYDPRKMFDTRRVYRGQAALSFIKHKEAFICQTKASQKTRDSLFSCMVSNNMEVALESILGG